MFRGVCHSTSSCISHNSRRSMNKPSLNGQSNLLYEYTKHFWTVYVRHERQLQLFHMRCLRQILRVKWQDCIPDTEILQRSHSRAIGSMLMDSQLRWAGHVARMPDYRLPDYRLPKRVFFGELCHGQRSRGRPKKRYKDTLKVALNRGRGRG